MCTVLYLHLNFLAPNEILHNAVNGLYKTGNMKLHDVTVWFNAVYTLITVIDILDSYIASAWFALVYIDLPGLVN